ncbi:hypothetical protein [Alteromonas gilva]|uniref:Tetratricopeptide repeat protein n=1 Tax=Alteromonas gilva TaxID=2987522 RepID=A0ABT5L6V8_9ALTE|nr:hypothetical protein [Alteromonas gilva]MDC8832803.1 hypothetical protein [Alteromonas gilva]
MIINVLLLILVVFVLYFLLKKKPSESKVNSFKSYVFREGENIEADKVFEAWTSGDINLMVAQLETPTNLIDRHFLLMGIVDYCYKKRSQPDCARMLESTALTHFKEFPAIRKALIKQHDMLPRVTTFQYFATYLSECGKYEEAIKVCQDAIGFGLHDNTKSGFEGRIKRITKKMESNSA